MNKMYYIGVDVSKPKLDVSFLGEHFVVSNDADGFQDLIRRISETGSNASAQVVFESTGCYHCALMHALRKAAITFSLVNPSRVRDFAKSKGILAKTDKIDAHALVCFAEAIKPHPTIIPNDSIREIGELIGRMDALVSDRVREKGRLETCQNEFAAEQIRSSLQTIADAIKDLDVRISEIVDGDPVLTAKVKLLCETTGVGKKIATTILSCFPEFGTLTRNGAAALAGLAPYNSDSSDRQRTRRIVGGRARGRRALYQAAVVAATHNENLRPFYQRFVASGKPKKVALVAVARKLAIYLNTRLKELPA